MTQQTYKTAKRRYFRGFFPIMGLYLLIILAGKFYLNSLDVEPQWLQAAVALACTVPMIAFIFLELRFITETDEYTRNIRYKALAYGASITISAVFLFGFLQLFDAIGPIEVFWFGPAYFVAYGLSSVLLGGRECL